MCNEHRFTMPVQRLIDEFSHQRIPLVFPGGVPNIEPRESIRIKDRGPIIQRDGASARLDMLGWSWPAPNGKPVFNFRSDGRRFDKGRCLIPTNGFYEFTVSEDPKRKRKEKWLFTMAGHDLFAIAGVVRGDAWAMLTQPPGPDIAPFHDRQVVVLAPDQWRAWLSGEPNEAELLHAAPAGTLKVERVPDP